jgi:hypothetical protein
MKIPTGAVALIVGCALASSCVSQRVPLVVSCGGSVRTHAITGPALVGAEYGVQTTPIPLNSVQFSDRETTKVVAVQRLYAARTTTNTVQVTARFVSCSDTPFNLRVRTSFLDGDQAPTEETSSWRSVYLQPRLTATYTEKSTSKNAESYLIEVAPNALMAP